MSSAAAADDGSELLLVGIVIRAHGLSGELTVEPHNPDSALWRSGTLMHLVPREIADASEDRVHLAGARALALTACRAQISQGRTRMLCRLDGITDRDQAEALKGTHLAVRPAVVDALGALDDDEFYHHELRGFAVRDTAGAPLGTVAGVFPAPGQDLIEVQPADPRADTWYVPFVAAIVVSVDRDARAIVIDPPEGLVP